MKISHIVFILSSSLWMVKRIQTPSILENGNKWNHNKWLPAIYEYENQEWKIEKIKVNAKVWKGER